MTNRKHKKKTVVGVAIHDAFKKVKTELAILCVKVSTPEDTTIEHISSILSTWKIPIPQEKVKLVTRLLNYSSFRVTVQMPKEHKNFWVEETCWPENTKVMKWNGDPNLPIPSQNTWELTKRMMIGKVDATQSTDNIARYVKTKVYGEISRHIKMVEVKRKPNLKSDAMYSAACVTITTHEGVEAARAFLKNGLMKN